MMTASQTATFDRRTLWQVIVDRRHVATVDLSWREINAGAREAMGVDELVLDAYARGTL